MIKAWSEQVTIPTYKVGQPEKAPLFLEKRVYQGSSGVVYPYPVIESIADEKSDETYKAVFIENEYIKVMILPELGGRVQMAYDKIKQRHFVYYNHVIKPALVGLVGPWISGGIEFNWPQHHRPSTFLPVDFKIEKNADKSVTVWVNEMEKMFHQKGMIGFTLRPGCAYLEIKGVLYNRTDLPQTFLWWANPAVPVNDQYQSVFPPDVNAVFDHGKRAVSSFPIATGTYYKMDYSAGVDISNYRNIQVPTSFMAVNSRFDFEGGYENDTRAGMLHVASHHLSPGKKQWTWGNGDFGRAWDRNLTDEDGPYIELMAGVYTENQPDFAWLMPYEEKHFVQYFMPYRELGMVKNASKDFLLNMEQITDGVRIMVFATSRQEVRVMLREAHGHTYYNKVVKLSPETLLDETVDVRGVRFDSLTLSILKDTHTVLRWQAEPDELKPVPAAAEAALMPADVKTVEQLYLTGLHLEQYRHATYSPVDYYEEGLRRDPQDYRCNNALGLWYLRRGRFAKAEEYLRKAVRVVMQRNPNPYDGEPIYNLGLALKYQGRLDEAYELFWKATWNKGWTDAAYFEVAKISVAQCRWADALDELNRCMENNWHNHKARALKTTVLRHLGRNSEVRLLIGESLELDRFNYGCWYEAWLLEKRTEVLDEMKQTLRRSINNYDELALDYLAAGLHEEAYDIWTIAAEENADSPMTYYYKGDFDKAERTSLRYCFPNRLEDVVALERAKHENPSGRQAPYLLGCLYYDKQQYDLAMENWRQAAGLPDESDKQAENGSLSTFPTVWRNLAIGTFNKLGQKEDALRMMERAFRLDESDARILMELDQLYRRLHKPHAERLSFLEKYPKLIAQRDDLLLEKITLLNQTGQYMKAMTLLDGHVFHPWEGGEGKVPAQYQICRVELSKQAISERNYSRAVGLLKECLEYPHHLGEGKLPNAQENDFYYFLGISYEGLGQAEKARECWEMAARGAQEPVAAIYYNDAKPDKIFYQGLALRRLDRENEARSRFHRLINYGKQHVFERQRMDYFAVSLPDLLIWEDSLDMKNQVHCKYMLALGFCGMGDTGHVLRYLDEVEALDNNHQGVRQLRTLINLGL